MLRVDALVGDVLTGRLWTRCPMSCSKVAAISAGAAPSRSAQAAHCKACSSCETPSP